jgi:hypothetical protein
MKDLVKGGNSYYDFNSGSDVAKEAGEYPTSFPFIFLFIPNSNQLRLSY